MVDERCPRCGGTSFRHVVDAWMRRSIPWTEDGVVKQCERCGEKLYVCPQCGGFLTRVNIANLRVMRATCPSCGFTDERIRSWLSAQRD